MTVAVAELYAVWVSDCWWYGSSSIVPSRRQEQRPSLSLHLPDQIQHRLEKNGSAGSNCTVLTLNLAKSIGSGLRGGASREEQHGEVNCGLPTRRCNE